MHTFPYPKQPERSDSVVKATPSITPTLKVYLDSSRLPPKNLTVHTTKGVRGHPQPPKDNIETVIENGNGRSIVAGKVNGLTFPESTFQPVGPNPFELPASASDPFSNSTSPFSNPAAQSPFTQPMPQVPIMPSKQDFGPGDYLWIIFVGYLLDPSNKAKVESMTPEQKSVLFRWRLAVAIPFLLLGLLVLAMMFL